MPKPITDHVFRPVVSSTPRYRGVAGAIRPCGYLNCLKPRAEHARSVSPTPTRLS